jgi:hypothetical protein
LEIAVKNANTPVGVTEVASYIAPTETAPWLVALLRDWITTLMLSRGVHAVQPSKTKMRDTLAEAAKAAATLLHALRDTPTREFLELEGNLRLENHGAIERTLGAIAECAPLAAASPQISTTAGVAKKGAGKALPATARSPKTDCAVIISELWHYFHGQYPAARNTEAAKAAEAYWRASGGTTKSWGSDPHGGWSYHFNKAKSPASEKLRQEIRRHCIEHSLRHQKLSESGE